MTKEQLLAALLVERYGPAPLPPAAPPHPVEQALAKRAASPPPVHRRHLRVLDGGSTDRRRRDRPPAQHTIGALMQIALDPDAVQLLIAVQQGRVHTDPQFKSPDFEKLADYPFGQRRATSRLRPLKAARLVELVDDEAAGGKPARPYKLTDLGEQVLSVALEQERVANEESAAS